MRRKGIGKRAVSVILALTLTASSGAMGVLAEEYMPEESVIVEMPDEESQEVVCDEPEMYIEPEAAVEPEIIDGGAEVLAADPSEEIEIEIPAEEIVAEEAEPEMAEESVVEDTQTGDPFVLSVVTVDGKEIPEDLPDDEAAVIDNEDEVVYGTMTMSYDEFYDGLKGVQVDAVSSATTGHSTSFSHADKGEVTDTDFMIYGVTDVPVEVYPDAPDDLKERVTPLTDGESYGQYWTVDANGITANLNVVEAVTSADPVLEINSHWADYELEVNETDTSYIRNTRSDDGFAVNSNLMGAVIGTAEGGSYGLWHLRNIWLQPYLIGFNAGDENTAGLVGQTITSVTYIMQDGSYVFTFADGLYVKPAYTGGTPTGEFDGNAAAFTLNDIPAGLQNPVLSITYSTGSGYNRTTVTLLSTSIEGAADGDVFTLDEAVPEGVVPTVQILSDNYAQIAVSYPMFDFQREELEALVAEGAAIVEAEEDANYSYSLLAAHVEEGTEVLESGDAAEAADIIDELGELIEAARTIYGTMTMSYEEFYDGKVTTVVDAVSSATTGHSTSFAHADKGEVTDTDFMIYGVTGVPVKVLPSASSDVKERVIALEDGESYDQVWTIDANGITANLNVVETVTTAEPVLDTNSHWADYELEVIETDTSYIRNTRSDDGFAVNSNLMGAVIGTAEGGNYGLWHLRNIWLQPYLIGFNSGDENTAGLVGQTITSVTYIMQDGSYEFTFADGLYVKPAYEGETPTGEFNDEATEFTLNEIPAGLQNPVLSITYTTGSSYNKTTHTLLSDSLDGAADGDTFTLNEAVPDGVVPTVQILSDNYAQIAVSYPMFDFQREELEALVEEGLAILEEQAVEGYNYDMLAEHVAEAQDVLANGDAYEAEDIIDELGELIDAYKNALPGETETEAPQTEAPQTETPQTETPQTETPQTEAPQTEAPQTEAPKTQPGTEKPASATTSTPVLLVKGSAAKKAVSLTWNKVKNADGYVIYGAKCGSKLKELATVTGRTNTSWKVKNLKAATSYKYRVKAYKTVNGKQKTLLKSNTAHVQTKGGKYTNVGKVKVSATKVSLGVGDAKKITVKTKLVNTKKKLKGHMNTLSFLSSDTSVAKVNKSGKITGVRKGSCYVYVLAADGVGKKISVTVK